MIQWKAEFLSAGGLIALLAAISLQGGAQAAEGASGYQINLLYTGEAWDNTMGGLRRGFSYMNNADVQLRVDAAKAWGVKGGKAVIEGFYANGISTGNTWVGALDQQSPIDTAAGKPMTKLYQAYYEQQFGHTAVLVGKYDLETEFSNTKPMSLFLSKNLTWNTALDQSGTMPNNGTIGPGNYPYTPLAVRVRQSFNDQWSLALAVANAASDDPKNLANNGAYFSPVYGAMIISEVDYTPVRYTKVMVGLWDVTSKLPAFGAKTPSGNQKYVYGEQGGYVGGETRLYAQEGRRGLDSFFTLGLSTPMTTNVSSSFNGGLTYTGLLDARPTDKMGVSFNINMASSYYKNSKIAQGSRFNSQEYSYEITYRAKLNDYVTVQPDAQYIVNPNFTPSLKNDLLVGLHFEIGNFFDL